MAMAYYNAIFYSVIDRKGVFNFMPFYPKTRFLYAERAHSTLRFQKEKGIPTNFFSLSFSVIYGDFVR